MPPRRAAYPRRAVPPRAHGTVSLAAAALALIVAVSSPPSVRSANALGHALHLNTLTHSVAAGDRALLAAIGADDGPFGLDSGGGGDVEPDDLEEADYGEWPRRRARDLCSLSLRPTFGAN